MTKSERNELSIGIIMFVVGLVIPGCIVLALYVNNKKTYGNIPSEELKITSGNGYFPLSYNPLSVSDLVLDCQRLINNKYPKYALVEDGLFGIKTLGAAKELFGHGYISQDDYISIGGTMYAAWDEDFYKQNFPELS